MDAIVLGGNEQGGKLSADNYMMAIYLRSIVWVQFSEWHLFGGILILSKMKIKVVYYCQKELHPQSVFTCSKLTIETLEQGLKYVQS